jgi:hypothetical protein
MVCVSAFQTNSHREAVLRGHNKKQEKITLFVEGVDNRRRFLIPSLHNNNNSYTNENTNKIKKNCMCGLHAIELVEKGTYTKK